MKIRINLLIMYIFFLSSPSHCENWELFGPNGSRIWCTELIEETDLVVIGTYYRGIYKADINNLVWSSAYQGLIDSISNVKIVDIQPVTGNPGQYLAGIYSDRAPINAYLYLSQDYCNSWSPIFVPVSCSGTFAIWVDPIDNEHWIWSGFTSGFRHTFNEGSDWEIINYDDNPGARKFYSLPANENVVFSISDVGPRPNPNMGGIEKSEDSGLNWNSVWNGPADSSYSFIIPSDITSDPFNNQHLVVVNQVDPGGFRDYRWMESFDGGFNWQPRILNFPSLYPYKIAYDALHQGVIYLGTVDLGLFKSEDNGDNWENVTQSITRGEPITSIDLDSNGKIYIALYEIGLFCSENGGNNWNNLTQNINGGTSGFFFDKDVNDQLLLSENGRLLLNDGISFNRVDVNLPLEAGLWIEGVFDPLNPGRMFAGLAYQNQGLPSLWFTDNQGLSWSSIMSQPSSFSNIYYLNKIFSGDPRLLMQVDSGNLWTYNNTIDVWQDITPPGSGFLYSDAPVSSQLVPGLIYYSSLNFAYRSENYGNSWTELDIPTGIYSISMYSDPMFPDMVWCSGLDDYPLFKSDDRGDNWSSVASLHFSSTQKVYSLCRFIDHPEVILVGMMQPYSTFISYNDGESWEAFEQGLNYQTSFTEMICYPADSSTIWAATSDGIKFLTWVGNSIDENGWQSPSEIRTSCFPNPFNATTVLTYTIPSSGEISLAIFDITGREVSTLVQEFQTAGSHSITWNAENQPSGLYFARLTTENGQAQTRKLVLMK